MIDLAGTFALVAEVRAHTPERSNYRNEQHDEGDTLVGEASTARAPGSDAGVAAPDFAPHPTTDPFSGDGVGAHDEDGATQRMRRRSKTSRSRAPDGCPR